MEPTEQIKTQVRESRGRKDPKDSKEEKHGDDSKRGPSRPSTPPPPYNPEIEDPDSPSYDIEICPATGNYLDIGEYRDEVNHFLRQLFRVDSGVRAKSPLEFIWHTIVVDDDTHSTVGVKFGLSTHGRETRIVFECAVDDFCRRVLNPNSVQVLRTLTDAGRLGFTPISRIFKRSWSVAAYNHSAALGSANYLRSFQGELARTGPEARRRARTPRWLMAMHCLFLSDGETFRSTVNYITGFLHTAPINPRERNEDRDLTDAAEGVIRQYIRDTLSLTVGRRNQLFREDVIEYRLNIGFITREITRLETNGYREAGTPTFGDAVFRALESSSSMLASNEEMFEMYLCKNRANVAYQAGDLAISGGFTARTLYKSINITREAASVLPIIKTTNVTGLIMGIAGLGITAFQAYKNNNKRKIDAQIKALHEKMIVNTRSSMNICYNVNLLLHILRYQLQTLHPQTLSHPSPEAQEWWNANVNNGVGTSFDIARVRTFMSLQRDQLRKNQEEFDRLARGRDLLFSV